MKTGLAIIINIQISASANRKFQQQQQQQQYCYQHAIIVVCIACTCSVAVIAFHFALLVKCRRDTEGTRKFLTFPLAFNCISFNFYSCCLLPFVDTNCIYVCVCAMLSAPPAHFHFHVSPNLLCRAAPTASYRSTCLRLL